MDDNKKERAVKVMQILPEPKQPQGLSSASMQAASENPRPRPNLRAQNLEPMNEEEQTSIRAEALRRSRVRQLSSGQLDPTQSSSPSQSNTREYAEHLAGKPLSDEEMQPEQPSVAQQRRVLGAEATQVLREFAAAAQAKGPRPSSAAQTPTPDWQTKQTGIPVTIFKKPIRE